MRKQVSSADVEDAVNLHHPDYKWRLTIAYDGTRFSGWQYQKSIPTVQCLVEQALTRVTKLEREDLQLVGAGRTDAGVHAYGQVAHFVTPFKYDSLGGFHKAINGLLSPDIRIREISSVVPEFHARFSVTSKIYVYKIYNDAVMDPFHRHYAFHSAHKLNAAAMSAAAKYFVGSHDYSAFSNVSRNDRVPNPVKNIIRFDVNEMGPLLQLEVEGSGFLYRQVRNMVALLLQVGREALPPEIVPKILASRDRKELAKFSFFIPPHGLCLLAIKYNEDHLRTPSDCPSYSREDNCFDLRQFPYNSRIICEKPYQFRKIDELAQQVKDDRVFTATAFDQAKSVGGMGVVAAGSDKPSAGF